MLRPPQTVPVHYDVALHSDVLQRTRSHTGGLRTESLLSTCIMRSPTNVLKLVSGILTWKHEQICSLRNSEICHGNPTGLFRPDCLTPREKQKDNRVRERPRCRERNEQYGEEVKEL